MRDLYTLAADPDVAAAWLEGVIEDCATAKPPELRSMGGTLRRWRDQILNWHITGASNGPTEALNLLITKIKRVGHSFRNFNNYRLRVLLYTGGCNWNLLGHYPRQNAKSPIGESTAHHRYQPKTFGL